MKIKHFFFSFLIGTSVYGQTKMTCEQQFQEFELFYKYDYNQHTIKTKEGKNEALNQINNLVEKCPSYSLNIYTIAEEMLSHIIQPINIGEERNVWVNHLINLYDKQSINFPETKSNNNIKKVLALYNNRVKEDTELLSLFDQYYSQDQDAFTTQALLVYVDLLVAQNKTQKDPSKEYIKRIDALNGDIQSQIISLTNELETADDQRKRYIKNNLQPLNLAARSMQANLKALKLDCNAWIELYKEDFEHNKSNISWLENVTNRLYTYRCTNNDFFENTSQIYYDLKKTPKSAKYMGDIALKNKNKEEATDYYTQSAALETNKIEKAKTYYKIADLHKGLDKALAKTNLEKAIENNPEMIEAYVILSHLYANADQTCTKSKFEQKALNLLAAQNIERIIKINPKFESSAKKIRDEYLKKAPTQDEIKKEKMSGKTISFGCWINQSITIK